jgi:hypothetical protein
MDAYATALLASLQSSAFRDIAGAQVSARVPISRALLNRMVADFMRTTRTPVRDVDIRPRDGDRLDVVISLTWPFVPPLTLSIAIEQQPAFPASPVLLLRWTLLGVLGTIASRVIASLDRLPPGVTLERDHLELDIPALASPTAAGAILPFVRKLELHTADDVVLLDVDLSVRQS